MSRIPDGELERLKQRISLAELCQSHGIELKRRGAKNLVGKCPFHDDGTPSLSIDPVKNVWHCFGCDKGGSVIDFVMLKENIPFAEAVARLQGNSPAGTGHAVQSATPPTRREPEPTRREAEPVKSTGVDPKLIESVITHYEKTLSGSDAHGLDYLKRRGLGDPETLKIFRAGYVNGTLKKRLPSAAIEPLQRLGILNEKGNEFFSGCVVVPVFTATGELGEMYGRSVEGSRHLYLPGPHRGVLNAKAAGVYEDVIVTEAILDALALYAIGVQNVIPCYGTGGFTSDHAAVLHQTKRIYIAFDNDEAGENGAKKLAERLTTDGRACHRVHLPPLDGAVKDLNDYVRHLRAQGMKPEEVKAAFAGLVQHAPHVGFRRTGGETGNGKPGNGNPGGLVLIEQTEAGLVFRNCDALYHLRGLYDNTGSSLRVILTARREDAVHTDRLDLYTAKHRVSFAYRAAHRLDLPAAKIEEDLNRLIPLLEKLLTENQNQGEAKPCRPEMTPAENQQAQSLLRDPRLLDRLAADLETVGYVGEERNKQLAYLIATSRKLNKPLSAIVRSESGAGKSYLMECVAELMPPEDVQYFSRLTPQSLYYMGRDELVHKLLIVDERDGSEESEYPIRTLQTRRKLTLAVPIKDPSSGRIKTKMLEILGPISYMESSTSATINPENLNRCFELYLDDSQAQTERIMAAQRRARTLVGISQDHRRESVLARHHNAQRLLRPLKVVTHFADHLKFPAQWLRTRRDNERFLSLLEIVTFLHQYQRPVKTSPDGVEHVETTLEDYRITHGLARTIFTQTLQDLGKPGKDLLDQIKEMVRDNTTKLRIEVKDYAFTRRTIREHTRMPDYTIKRAIRELEELEYLDVRRSGQGGTHRYRLTTQHTALSGLDGLTTPEELAENWDNWNRTGTRPQNELKA